MQMVGKRLGLPQGIYFPVHMWEVGRDNIGEEL